MHHLTNRWPQWFTVSDGTITNHRTGETFDARRRRWRGAGRRAPPARHRRPARAGGPRAARRARRGAGGRRRVGVLPEPLGPDVEARPAPRRCARSGVAAQRPTRRLGRHVLRTTPTGSQLLAPRVVGARHRRAVPTDRRHGTADRPAPGRRRRRPSDGRASDCSYASSARRSAGSPTRGACCSRCAPTCVRWPTSPRGQRDAAPARRGVAGDASPTWPTTRRSPSSPRRRWRGSTPSPPDQRSRRTARRLAVMGTEAATGTAAVDHRHAVDATRAPSWPSCTGVTCRRRRSGSSSSTPGPGGRWCRWSCGPTCATATTCATAA